MPPQDAMLRVMVVDDSSVVRGFLTRFLEEDPAIRVIIAAPDGRQALKEMQKTPPDVAILDIDMPVMGGLTALPLMLQRQPGLPVIIVSTRTPENAALALTCLKMGAADVMAKPTAQEMATQAEAGGVSFKEMLVTKVKTLGGLKTTQLPAVDKETPPPVPAAPLQESVDAIAICSSTGGPQALLTLFAGLDAPLPVPVFITQHMPATFTTVLAENISVVSGLACHEAVAGEAVLPGKIYIAPGDYHLLVEAQGGRKFISLGRQPPENFCRPAADAMLRSLAAAYGPRLLTLMLTGMGQDGLAGCRILHALGAPVVAQDKNSSVVWGMPGAVAAAGLCTEVLPLQEMPALLRRYTRGSR